MKKPSLDFRNDSSWIRMSDPTPLPMDALRPYLEQINSRRRYTNRGPLVEQLELELAKRIGGGCHISLVSSGTTALISVLKASGVRGEIITTPYTYIATTASILWAGCNPVFADVEPDGFNICPKSASKRITPATVGMIAVHCDGESCDHEAPKRIADRHGIRIFYDAAHVRDFAASPLNPLRCGDFSAVSLHATKVFHAVEGGIAISWSAEAKRRIDQVAGFGLESECHASDLGLNGRMSEVHAAIGLANLDLLEGEIEARKMVCSIYHAYLATLDEITLSAPQSPKRTAACSYFPIRVRQGQKARDALLDHLQGYGIEARRYFFPLSSEFEAFRGASPASPQDATPEAFRASREVLCLPVHGRMTNSDATRIATCIQMFFN